MNKAWNAMGSSLQLSCLPRVIIIFLSELVVGLQITLAHFGFE